MNDNGIFGNALGQLGQTVKQGVKQVVKVPQELAQDAGGQIGAVKEPAASAPLSGASGEPRENKPQKQWQSDEERVKFLRDLYGPTELEEPIKDKSPEEQKKLLELRNQLHKENYYDPTFSPVKKQEERPAEKVENEKKQEMVDLQKEDAKKPPPLAVVREQNKTEQFRGASG